MRGSFSHNRSTKQGKSHKFNAQNAWRSRLLMVAWIPELNRHNHVNYAWTAKLKNSKRIQTRQLILTPNFREREVSYLDLQRTWLNMHRIFLLNIPPYHWKIRLVRGKIRTCIYVSERERESSYCRLRTKTALAGFFL